MQMDMGILRGIAGVPETQKKGLTRLKTRWQSAVFYNANFLSNEKIVNHANYFFTKTILQNKPLSGIKNPFFNSNQASLKTKKMKKLFYTLLVTVVVLINKNAVAQTRIVNRNPRFVSASQQGQLQGSILFADNNIIQQLQQGWNANISRAAGTKIKVELWQVNYIPSKKDNTYTDIFLIQKLDANISYQLVQNGIQYSASYRPIAGNVVAIAYTTVPANAQIKFSGKPNDGVPASITHQFRSDAKKYLGNNVIYGIYSLPRQGGNPGDASFKVMSSIKANCKNCFGFDDVWDTVTDAANDVANLVKAAVDGTGEAVKDLGETIVVNNGIFFVQCFGTIATYLQTGNLPKVRMLSDYGNAYNIANSTIFMGSLPPVNKIIVTNLMSIDKRPFTVPIKTGNDVYILMNLGNAFEDPLNYNMNGFTGDVFIHELTHAWQIWHVDALRLFMDGAVNQFKNTVISNQYSYSCDGHNLTDSYNEEQQAMIVQLFYATLFYSSNGVYNKGGKITCGFEQQWVVQNILRNQPQGINDLFTATQQIIAASTDRTLAGYTGGVIDHTIAVPSNGNRVDGAGYFLPGKNNNSFFYYSNKTKAVTANWGPIRDKYTKAGYEFGALGWPEINEVLLPDAVGHFQRFNHGFIYWHPKHGAYVIPNKIFDAWKGTGWEKGKLGYPVSDYVQEPMNKFKQVTQYREKGYQKFEGGVIFYAVPDVIAIAAIAGNNNYASISYGNPDRILATDQAAISSVQPDGVEINPQPLPPKTVKSSVSNTNPQVEVAINPKPLPPKNVRRAGGATRQAKVEINPQPLPPKTKRQ
jgi:LGFP repeat